ncbi:MAG: hypothetical protein E5Y81_09370, partial [Mesorhizobium sp.]
PYPFKNAVEMLSMAAKSGLSIADMKRVNEETQMSREELDAGLDGIWSAMKSCIERGLSQDGIMPGGLKVRRRARQLHDKLPLDAAIETMRQTGLDMNEKYKETSLGGLAVNIVEC